MKTKIILVLIFIIVLTGCGANNLKCTATYNDTIKYSVKITSKVNNKKISNATVRMTFNNSDDATNMCELNKLSTNKNVIVSCYEKEVIIRNYEYTLMGNEKTPITKDDFIKKLKDQGFKCQ